MKGRFQLRKYANASFKGTYGFVIIFGAKSVIGLGVATPDGNGNMKGVQTLNFGGKVIPHTFEGTYTVNADGTASASLTFIIPDGSKQHGDFDYVVLSAEERKSCLVVTELQGFAIEPGAGGTLGFIHYKKIP